MEERKMQHPEFSEDLRFVRSMIDRTRPRIDAAAPILLTWGVICLIGFPFTEWLVKNGRPELVDRLWFVLTVLIGAPLSAYFGWRASKRCAEMGVTPYVAKQIGWLWAVLVPNGVLWGFLVRFGLDAPYLMPFVWAAVYGIGLAVMGILYSKEWLIAGIAVFAAIPIAALHLSHSGTLLGITMGLCCMVPALISMRNRAEARKAVHA
jgi:hypothetical protein